MSLQDKIDRHPTVIEAVTTHIIPGPRFPYPMEHTNWRDEQRAWTSTAVLFNQSWHMTDLYLSGPDVIRLLSDTSVNSYAKFRPGGAKQYLALTAEGYVVGDGILFWLDDDPSAGDGHFVIVALEPSLNWLTYHAKIGGYDVQIEREPAGWGRPGSVPKRMYRYELEGPTAWRILEAAAGKKLDPIGFFRTGELELGGVQVRALNHTMGGVPGQESTGLELFGPVEDTEAFLQVIRAAGAEHGLLEGGSKSYGSTTLESGWIGSVIPGIYTDPSLKAYRESVADTAIEANITSINGSFRPAEIDAYYTRPWDLGYGHMVKFDHDFIGRAATEAAAEGPNRRRVWLSWNPEDTASVLVDSILDRDPRPREPIAPYFQVRDAVLAGDETVGFTHITGYTVNLGGWTSIASVEEQHAVDGAQVEILWGDFDGGASDPHAVAHVQRRIRATVHTKSPMA